MKITTISILEKMRAPSRIEFRKGLVVDVCCDSSSLLSPGAGERDEHHANGDVHHADRDVARENPDQAADGKEQASDCVSVHRLFSFKVQFSTAPLPQRLAVSCDSDNTANIAYMGFQVKPNRKSPYFRAFSGFAFWIKKFSSPKMRNREFVFTPKIEYELVAERPVVSSVEPSEANLSNLQFPYWCPRQESNLDIGFRKPVFCPLNYGGLP